MRQSALLNSASRLRESVAVMCASAPGQSLLWSTVTPACPYKKGRFDAREEQAAPTDFPDRLESCPGAIAQFPQGRRGT